MPAYTTKNWNIFRGIFGTFAAFKFVSFIPQFLAEHWLEKTALRTRRERET
jgi:hypothetical protein